MSETLFVTIAGTIIAMLAYDEFRSWAPRITKYLTKMAVRQLPKDVQHRYEEEWASDLNELPSDLSRLLCSAGYIIASFQMEKVSTSQQGSRATAAAKRMFDLTVTLYLAMILAPFALVCLAIRLDSPGPAFYSQTRIGRGGKPFGLLKFRTTHSDTKLVAA